MPPERSVAARFRHVETCRLLCYDMHAWQAEGSLHASPRFTLAVVLNWAIPLSLTHTRRRSCLFVLVAVAYFWSQERADWQFRRDFLVEAPGVVDRVSSF